MKNQLRDKLESAALRLDDYLGSAPQGLDGNESTLLSVADDIAEAIDLLSGGAP